MTTREDDLLINNNKGIFIYSGKQIMICKAMEYSLKVSVHNETKIIITMKFILKSKRYETEKGNTYDYISPLTWKKLVLWRR